MIEYLDINLVEELLDIVFCLLVRGGIWIVFFLLYLPLLLKNAGGMLLMGDDKFPQIQEFCWSLDGSFNLIISLFAEVA